MKLQSHQLPLLVLCILVSSVYPLPARGLLPTHQDLKESIDSVSDKASTIGSGVFALVGVTSQKFKDASHIISDPIISLADEAAGDIKYFVNKTNEDMIDKLKAYESSADNVDDDDTTTEIIVTGLDEAMAAGKPDEPIVSEADDSFDREARVLHGMIDNVDEVPVEEEELLFSDADRKKRSTPAMDQHGCKCGNRCKCSNECRCPNCKCVSRKPESSTKVDPLQSDEIETVITSTFAPDFRSTDIIEVADPGANLMSSDGRDGSEEAEAHAEVEVGELMDPETSPMGEMEELELGASPKLGEGEGEDKEPELFVSGTSENPEAAEASPPEAIPVEQPPQLEFVFPPLSFFAQPKPFLPLNAPVGHGFGDFPMNILEKFFPTGFKLVSIVDPMNRQPGSLPHFTSSSGSVVNGMMASQPRFLPFLSGFGGGDFLRKREPASA